jgi:N-acetylneuraminic acid mutarotase
MSGLPFVAVMASAMTIAWTERQPMPRAEAGAAVGAHGGELIVAGGTAWNADVKLWLKDVQVYTPQSNTWRRGPDLPVPLAYGPFITAPEGLEIFGGSDGKTSHREAWKLVAGKWTRSGDVPADVLLGRAVRVGESVFLFGGCPDAADLTRCSDSVWRRDNSEWRRVSRLPDGPVALPAVAGVASSIYLFGGCSMPAAGQVVNHDKAYRYDPQKNEWTTLRDLPAGVRGMTALTVNDAIYLFGGYTDAGFSAEVLVYDPKTDQYRRTTPLPAPVLGAEFVRIGDRLYGAGGEDRMRSRTARLLEGHIR